MKLCIVIWINFCFMNYQKYIGTVAVIWALSACWNPPPDAIWVTVDTQGKTIKILTRKQKIICISGIEGIKAQNGNLFDTSFISKDVRNLDEWKSHITMFVEKNSGDITIKNGDATVATFRKGDSKRYLKEFRWVWPTSYCESIPNDGIELR